MAQMNTWGDGYTLYQYDLASSRRLLNLHWIILLKSALGA